MTLSIERHHGDAWFGDLHTYQLRQLGVAERTCDFAMGSRGRLPTPRSGDELVSAAWADGGPAEHRWTSKPWPTNRGAADGYSQQRWDSFSAQYGVRGRVYSRLRTALPVVMGPGPAIGAN